MKSYTFEYYCQRSQCSCPIYKRVSFFSRSFSSWIPINSQALTSPVSEVSSSYGIYVQESIIGKSLTTFRNICSPCFSHGDKSDNVSFSLVIQQITTNLVSWYKPTYSLRVLHTTSLAQFPLDKNLKTLARQLLLEVLGENTLPCLSSF